MADLGVHRFRKNCTHPFRMLGRFEVTVDHSCTRKNKNLLQTNCFYRLGTNAEWLGLRLIDLTVTYLFNYPLPQTMWLLLSLTTYRLFHDHMHRLYKEGKTAKHAGTRLLKDPSLALLFLLFFAARLRTYGNFIGMLFENLEKWLCIAPQLCKAIGTHTKIIHPKYQDILLLSCFFCY